jgi:hypothetical protein
MKNRRQFAFIALTFGLLLPGLLKAPEARASAPRTLIELSDGAPKPALAKSWTKIKDGEYEFVLDTSAELMNGKALTTAAVKATLEKKLGKSNGVTVKETSADKVTITYTGAEADFLKQLSEVKIRATSTDVAADSGGSDGGIRARPPGVELADGEIKGFVLKVQKVQGHYVFKIVESKFADLKVGDAIDLKITGVKLRKNHDLYFQPEKDADGIWTAKEGTLTREQKK